MLPVGAQSLIPEALLQRFNVHRRVALASDSRRNLIYLIPTSILSTFPKWRQSKSYSPQYSQEGRYDIAMCIDVMHVKNLK